MPDSLEKRIEELRCATCRKLGDTPLNIDEEDAMDVLLDAIAKVVRAAPEELRADIQQRAKAAPHYRPLSVGKRIDPNETPWLFVDAASAQTFIAEVSGEGF